MKKQSSILCIILLSATVSLIGCAEQNRQGSDRNHKPPEEAFTACKDKKAGDTVTFYGQNGEKIEAKCTLINDQLVAVPENQSNDGPPSGGGRGRR